MNYAIDSRRWAQNRKYSDKQKTSLDPASSDVAGRAWDLTSKIGEREFPSFSGLFFLAFHVFDAESERDLRPTTFCEVVSFFGHRGLGGSLFDLLKGALTMFVPVRAAMLANVVKRLRITNYGTLLRRREDRATQYRCVSYGSAPIRASHVAGALTNP